MDIADCALENNCWLSFISAFLDEYSVDKLDSNFLLWSTIDAIPYVVVSESKKPLHAFKSASERAWNDSLAS